MVVVLSVLFVMLNVDVKLKVKDEVGGVAFAFESEDDVVVGDVKVFVELM